MYNEGRSPIRFIKIGLRPSVTSMTVPERYKDSVADYFRSLQKVAPNAHPVWIKEQIDKIILTELEYNR